VYLYWQPDDSAYFGYWDSSPDGSPGESLAALSPTRSTRQAVEWGRHRAPRVLIRPKTDPGVYYWAGVGEPVGTDIDLKRLSSRYLR
jgi:hypothetical protein